MQKRSECSGAITIGMLAQQSRMLARKHLGLSTFFCDPELRLALVSQQNQHICSNAF